MCDILVATPAVTADGATIFAKNADRDPNEAQVLELHPRQQIGEGRRETTRVTVDLERTLADPPPETNAVLLSRPWWTWGTEMGANEHGLVGGNVAVFTREPDREEGLLGMDVLRLVLELAADPREAVTVAGRLLERVGVGGDHSRSREFRYDNAFAFADAESAWILESAGPVWVAKRVDGAYTLSNRLTIDDEWDLSSTIDPRERAVDRGWHDGGSFSFAECYTDPGTTTRFSRARERQRCTAGFVDAEAGAIDREAAVELLRRHDHEPYDPQAGSMRDVCMHYGGTLRPSQAASSQVSVLEPDEQVHWLTGTSNPCLSLFKPVTFEGGLPDLGPEPTDRYDPETRWWRAEALTRAIETNFERTAPAVRRDLGAAQQEVIESWADRGADEPGAVTEAAFDHESRLWEAWESAVDPGATSIGYGLRWRLANRRAGLEVGHRLSPTATVRSLAARVRRATGSASRAEGADRRPVGGAGSDRG